MVATPLPPASVPPGNPNPEGIPAAPAAPPGTDMTGISFRDQIWLNAIPLDSNTVFDYFALSPFYDRSCNNENLRSRSIHPLDLSHLSKMTGSEYMLSDVMEPHLFVIRKQRRDGPEKVSPMLVYYVLDGSIYQAPTLCNVFASRISRVLYHISKSFFTAASKLEKIGHAVAEDESPSTETKVEKETIDIKELKRVDHILGSLLRKANGNGSENEPSYKPQLPPAPPPPPFPEGYAPQQSEAEKNQEDQQLSEQQPPPLDPVIDQGPSKRFKFQ